MLADKNATGHSIFGPSSAHRWMRCPRSLIEGYLAGDKPTYYAAEGSVAHWLGEGWLTSGSTWVYQQLGTTQVKDGFEIEITEEMISYIEEYVEICSTDYSGTHYVEVKVDLSKYTPVPSFGTSDFIRAEWQKLKVKDLKYGKVWVDPDDNEQGLAYALGAFEELDWLYDFQEIEIQIVQPRRENYGVWTITRAELLEFGERYRAAAHAAWDPNAAYNPDPIACEYCPARRTCPALADIVTKIAQNKFEDIPDGYSPDQAVAVMEAEVLPAPILPAYNKMPIAKLAAMYEWRAPMEKWFRELYDYLLEQADYGIEIPGQKLGKGRAGNRKFVDWKGARKFLLENGVEALDLWDLKTISPAEASRLLRLARGGTKKANDALIADFVIQPEGKLTLIPAYDKREALPSAVSAFPDDDDDI